MRKSWHETFFAVADEMAKRSTCKRRQYGCVAVRDKTIISTGYNGAPRGLPHCTDIGCARKGMKSGTHPELCRATHAEQNVVANAARMGVSLLSATVYIKDIPCVLCAKILINAGILDVIVTGNEYPDYMKSQVMFSQAGIKLWFLVNGKLVELKH
jgi:dCMP deaminase